MEKPSALPATHEAAPRRTVPVESDPVLLSLPRREPDTSGASCVEKLQVIATGSGPKVETAFLTEVLTANPELGRTLLDPCEVHNYANPLASVNAFKHRLHAIRCEFINAQSQIRDLRTRLDAAAHQHQIQERRIQLLHAEMDDMRASRAWKLADKLSMSCRSLSHMLRRVLSLTRGPVSSPR